MSKRGTRAVAESFPEKAAVRDAVQSKSRTVVCRCLRESVKIGVWDIEPRSTRTIALEHRRLHHRHMGSSVL
jgi:hypothetical protein